MRVSLSVVDLSPRNVACTFCEELWQKEMLILLKGHRRFLYYSSKPRANQHTSQLEYLYLFFCGREGNRRIKGIVTLAHMLLCVLARLKLKRILKLQKCYDKLTDPT